MSSFSEGSWNPHTSVEESREVIRTVLSVPETYAIIWKETGEPVGCISLTAPRLSAQESTKALELGYWTARPYWGSGHHARGCKTHAEKSF